MRSTLRQFWIFIHIDVEQIEGGIISSVVPQVTNAAKLALEKILEKK